MANQLSNLDFPQVLKDAHRPEEHAIAVIGINELVPKSFSKVFLTYLTSGPAVGEVEKVYYYNNGTQEISEIACREDYLGTAEITTLNFTGLSPAGLDGKFFLIYDGTGSVGVWFDLDNSSTPPITGALRDIEIDISTGDSPSAIALAAKTVLNADSEFIAIVSTTIVVVSSVQVGNKTNALDVNTGIVITISDGTAANTLNNKYFLINSGGNETQYYVWYNVGGTGVDPAPAGKTEIEVAISSGATAATVANATKAAIELTGDFTVSLSGSTITITTVKPGITTDVVDFNAGHNEYSTIQQGEDRGLVATILLTYNSNGELESAERL